MFLYIYWTAIYIFDLQSKETNFNLYLKKWFYYSDKKVYMLFQQKYKTNYMYNQCYNIFLS